MCEIPAGQWQFRSDHVVWRLPPQLWSLRARISDWAEVCLKRVLHMSQSHSRADFTNGLQETQIRQRNSLSEAAPWGLSTIWGDERKREREEPHPQSTSNMNIMPSLSSVVIVFNRGELTFLLFWLLILLEVTEPRLIHGPQTTARTYLDYFHKNWHIHGTWCSLWISAVLNSYNPVSWNLLQCHIIPRDNINSLLGYSD